MSRALAFTGASGEWATASRVASGYMTETPRPPRSMPAPASAGSPAIHSRTPPIAPSTVLAPSIRRRATRVPGPALSARRPSTSPTTNSDARAVASASPRPAWATATCVPHVTNENSAATPRAR